MEEEGREKWSRFIKKEEKKRRINDTKFEKLENSWIKTMEKGGGKGEKGKKRR